MNLLEMFHALMVSPEVAMWHYPAKKEGNKFIYWLKSEPGNKVGHDCATLEELITEAYAHIDPLNVPIPETFEKPEAAVENNDNG